MGGKTVSRKIKVILTATLIFLLSLSGAALAKGPQISTIYAFGDSSIDNGRANKLTTEIYASSEPPAGAYIKAPKEFFWEGRYSNGYTFTELLAQRLDAKYENWAVGGAESGYSNWSKWMDPYYKTGGIGQVDDFLVAHGNIADPNGIYYISIGGNDTYKVPTNPNSEDIKNVAEQTANNIATIVENLANAGATKFVINEMSHNSKDILANNPDSTSSKFTDFERSKLSELIPSLEERFKIDILLVDLDPIWKNITAKSKNYGFEDLTNPYLISTSIESDFGGYQMTFDNGPDSHIFWDEWHLTAKTHKIISDQIYPQLVNFLKR